ncbi:RWD domain-containing protein [Elsinoe australis]|uniref:RWD domain-containing protein n=1 Tax=Elsinoe australis TaxID=40998 RepID=A0A4U7APU9_9PEZI|nr:RWD domain-containing protein [Elsinoe australis]
MGRDDQIEEREVLSSIFPDEITDISETEYRISIALDITPESEDEPPPPTILLHVSYPDTYPDTAPRLDINSPPNASRHPQLDVQEDKSLLLKSLDSTIEENLGMAMVFTLVTTLKEAAEQLILDRKAEVQAEKDEEAAKAEAEENRKFEGTKVTRETFLAWRERFRKEMEEEKERAEREREEELKRKKIKEEKKLTGKELWVRGMAGNVAEEGEDEGEDVVEGMRELKVK